MGLFYRICGIINARIIVLIYLVIFFISCINEPSKNNSTSHEINQQDSVVQLGCIGIEDTLEIKIHFTECGEWGGHSEAIKIYRANNSKLYAQYTIDTVSCEKLMKDVKYEVASKNVVDTTKLIDKKDERQIITLLQRLFQLSLVSKISSNSGEYYEVFCRPKGLQFSYWNSSYNETNYSITRQHLFGNIIKELDSNVRDKFTYIRIVE